MVSPRVVLLLTLLFLFALGCQQIDPPRTELTQNQWRQVQNHLLEEAPEPQHPMGVIFDGNLMLLGFDLDGELRPGGSATVTWYWQALEDIHKDWKIFVHLDSDVERLRQNLDRYPLAQSMNEIYRTYHLREGHILADRQTFVLREDFPPGDATFFVGLFRGEPRAPATGGRTTEDHRGIGPTVEILP